MNEDIIEKWCDFAKADLDAAERLFESKKPTSWTYLLSLWHCHQTIEKALKMIIVNRNKDLLKIHDLARLANIAELKINKKRETFLEDLNGFYLHSRYPDVSYAPLPKTNRKMTEEYLTKTKEFFLWLQKQI